ncbi:MAG: hypothetical protein C4519_26815 [Desulfobacteraceae bacterium]|nr:MAG: hypothetical protein C4519_26815 [Desulfobacteraceae bacterium]
MFRRIAFSRAHPKQKTCQAPEGKFFIILAGQCIPFYLPTADTGDDKNRTDAPPICNFRGSAIFASPKCDVYHRCSRCNGGNTAKSVFLEPIA